MSRLLENKPTLIASAMLRLGRLAITMLSLMPGGRVFRETAGSQVPIDFYRWFCQRVVGINAGAYWPMHPTSDVSYAKRVLVGIETSPGWSKGCYIHGINGIYVGDYTQIAPNVGLISGNHDNYDLSSQVEAAPIRIGKYCLLGMNVVILPGVELGDYTIVASNAVVAQSFPEGFAVLGGVPAKVLKQLDPSLRKDYSCKNPYHGYIPAAAFSEFKSRHLKIPGDEPAAPPVP